MTAQLPHGLIRVVSASHTEITSTDPADIIFERKQALFNFWKVHDAQSRAIQDASNIRCRQLFWRVWSNPRLSVSLSQDTMMRLWMQCQQDFDLSPFQLLITDGNAPSSYDTVSSSATQIPTGRLSKQSPQSGSSVSLSPTQMLSPRNDSVASTEPTTRPRKASSQATRPPIARTASGSEANRKRSSVTTSTRGKARPTMPRKKSSQSTQILDTAKPRKSIIKSPTSHTAGGEASDPRRDSRVSIVGPITQSPTSPATNDRKISVFELPSVSSWQSDDSHPDPFANNAKNPHPQTPSSLLVDRNFREKFVETQKQLRSSTNLAGMNKAMRKTGSVVRFADEVDTSEDLQKLKGIARTSPLATRAASDGQQAKTSDELSSRKQPPLVHRDSVGSVAAISDDSSDDVVPELPRTKSQLSMAIASLKRGQSAGEAGNLIRPGVTSPEIEQEQEALIKGAIPKKKTEEEEKLLAMAHKDGVTKAGGINMPKQMTVTGSAFEFGSSYDSPEEPIF